MTWYFSWVSTNFLDHKMSNHGQKPEPILVISNENHEFYCKNSPFCFLNTLFQHNSLFYSNINIAFYRKM